MPSAGLEPPGPGNATTLAGRSNTRHPRSLDHPPVATTTIGAGPQKNEKSARIAPWWHWTGGEQHMARSCSSRPRRSAKARGETPTEGCRRRAEGGGATHRTNAGSARQKPHPPRRVAPRVRERSGCRQSLPGGHQDDGYWRSLHASLIAADDLLTWPSRAEDRGP